MDNSHALARYPVMEHFYTIQGEGTYAGVPAYFIRLAGCDVGCVWCDVKESWKTEGYPRMSVKEMLTHINREKSKMVVITGGEPCMYNLDSLTKVLNEQGIHTHIETSGAYKITGHWDWVCVSPKKFKAPLQEALSMANELKVVVYNKSDFEWAKQNAQDVSEKCQLILNPEWDNREKMMPLMVNYVKNNPKWRIGLQIHKYLRVP